MLFCSSSERLKRGQQCLTRLSLCEHTKQLVSRSAETINTAKMNQKVSISRKIRLNYLPQRDNFFLMSPHLKKVSKNATTYFSSKKVVRTTAKMKVLVNSRIQTWLTTTSITIQHRNKIAARVKKRSMIQWTNFTQLMAWRARETLMDAQESAAGKSHSMQIQNSYNEFFVLI